MYAAPKYGGIDQMTEDRKQKTEDRGQRTEFLCAATRHVKYKTRRSRDNASVLCPLSSVI
jgi:hypothetical protein